MKNAPTEGDYTKDIAVTHKPFGIETRLVRCLRCGKRGHQAGDRECNLAGKDPKGWKISNMFYCEIVNVINFCLSFLKILQISNMKIH